MLKHALAFLVLILAGLGVSAAAEPAPPAEKPQLRIGLTPIFLDDQAEFVNRWHDYIEHKLGRPIIFVQRGSYREIVDMLLDDKLDFAWLCGYPFTHNKQYLRLVAVPLYKGEPYYRSYLIVPTADKKTQSLEDMRGKIFAFSDPDSSSGYLYPEYLLASEGENLHSFFSRTFFTWSHRKVIEAVAVGLAQGGTVDGYIWDTMAQSHPELTSKTRVVLESSKFGHPPFVAGPAATGKEIVAMRETLTGMQHDPEGIKLLKSLNLNGFVNGHESLYDEIEQMARIVEQNRTHEPQRH